jgi:hypothetical protein
MGARQWAVAKAENAGRRAVERVVKLGPRLHAILAMEEDRPVSPEKLLLMLVAAVRGDGELDMSFTEVKGIGRRNERLAAAAAVFGGPGYLVADMYCDATLLCLLADCFELDLPNDEIAAHLLVMWQAMPDLATARRALDAGDDSESVTRHASSRFKESVSSKTKKDTLVTLWRLRSGGHALPALTPATVKNVLRAGRALQQRLDEAADELGLGRDRVRSGFAARLTSRRRLADRPAEPSQAVCATGPSGWHPDPAARFDYRYFDGFAWTELVSSDGWATTDPPDQLPLAPVGVSPFTISPGAAGDRSTTP